MIDYDVTLSRALEIQTELHAVYRLVLLALLLCSFVSGLIYRGYWIVQMFYGGVNVIGGADWALCVLP